MDEIEKYIDQIDEKSIEHFKGMLEIFAEHMIKREAWVETAEMAMLTYDQTMVRLPEETIFDQDDRERLEKLRLRYEQNEAYDEEWGKKLRQRCTKEIVTKGFYYHLLPWDYERGGQRKGQVIEYWTPSSNLKKVVFNLFDEKGRIVYRHMPDWLSHDICEYDGQQRWIYSYRSEELSVCMLYLPQENICYGYEKKGIFKEQFIYDVENRLQQVIHYGKRHEAVGVIRYDYHYEFEAGVLQWIVLCIEDGYSRLLYY